MTNPPHPYLLIIIGMAFAVVPLLIAVCSCYLKVSIVLGLLRSGFGAQGLPPQSVVMALSLSITMLAMWPVVEKIQLRMAQLDPAVLVRIPNAETIGRLADTLAPWKEFLAKHAGNRELLALAAVSRRASDPELKAPPQRVEKEVSWRLVVPAFILAELKHGMILGFSLLLPFLLVDLLVANLLAGLGMYMLSPISISLPLKLLLFVYADGWLLVTEGLIRSYLAVQ